MQCNVCECRLIRRFKSTFTRRRGPQQSRCVFSRAVTRLPITRRHPVIERRRREWRRRGGSAVGGVGCGTVGVPLSTGGGGCVSSPEKFSIFSLKIAIFGAFCAAIFLQFSGPFCTQIMLIDDRPYKTFPSGPKNEEAVASSCLNVVTALFSDRRNFEIKFKITQKVEELVVPPRRDPAKVNDQLINGFLNYYK